MLSFNKNLLYATGLLITSLFTLGCKKDFLEINPKGFLIANKTADYELMLNSAGMAQFDGAFPHLLMSDELAGWNNLSQVASVPDGMAFRWAADRYQPNSTTSEITALIRQLYIYNKIINNVMDSEAGNAMQKKAIRAEAYVGRAWINYMLANFYGKPYNAPTATTDLAAPVIMEADVTQTHFSRASVQQMYDQMISDLTVAIPDLPATVTNRGRASKAAAEAMLGKVYVAMNKFDLALPLLEAFMTDLAGASIPVGIYDYKAEFATGGAFLPVDQFNGPNRINSYIDKEIVYLRATINFYNGFYDGVLINPQASALYTSSDQRLKFFTNTPFGGNIPYPAGFLRLWGGGYTNTGIGVPDIYLLRTECKARLNKTTEAVNDLLAFRLNRMSVADAAISPTVAGDQKELVKFILQERIRELPLTGERWMDMRRLSVDPIYSNTVGNVHKIYDDQGKVIETIALTPERLTLRFAPYITAANADMPQNP